MELTHVPQDQDRKTFFRTVFFGAENWRTTDDAGTETALISADVEIDGADLGRHRLEVFHRPYRGQVRGRATTFLRWGDVIRDHLRRHDVSRCYLLVERADIDTYRLRVTRQEPR